MKKVFLCSVVLFFLTISCGFASAYSNGTDFDVNGTAAWSDATLDWTITEDAGIFTYVYTFHVPEKAISHLIIEVSETFTAENILDGTTLGYVGPDFYDENNGNPGLTAGFDGLKWNTSDNPLDLSVTIVTDREPMLGDFYAKDGQDDGAWVYAWVQGAVWVPDTNGGGGGGGGDPVPEPATMLLVGIGIVGIGASLRKKFVK